MSEPGLNRIEIVVSFVYATMWALIALSLGSLLEFGESLRPLLMFAFVPPAVCAFVTVFVLTLAAHLFVASRRVPRERFGLRDHQRLIPLVAITVMLVSAWILSYWTRDSSRLPSPF